MQNTALNILKTGQNVFLTGSAGTGKTYILNEYILYLKSRKIYPTIVAPTGIAASHLSGQTIHSFFSLGIRDEIDESFIQSLVEKKYLQMRFSKLSVLIIDETSMVSPFIFTAMNTILKAFKKNDKPFGGIQVILSGDFFQLPPISRTKTNKRFAWQAPSWKELDLQTCYLEKKFRQNDDVLISILDEIRSGKISSNTHDALNSRIGITLDTAFKPTKLYTHNLDVDKINNDELNKLSSPAQSFFYTSQGAKSNIEKIFKSSLVQETMILKKDAVVMFIKNNPEKGYINGTTGIVVDFSKDENLPIVKLSNGYTVKVPFEDWSIENDKGSITAKVSQLPLKLSWAITIHKSQGMTLDSAQIDLSKTFEVGQGYVALSRIKSIEGLQLIGFNDTALMVDSMILSIDDRIKQASKKSQDKISSFSNEELEDLTLSHVRNLGGITNNDEIEKQKKELKEKPKVSRDLADIHHKTKDLIQDCDTIEELAIKRELGIDTIIKHLGILKQVDKELDLQKYIPDSDISLMINTAIEKIKTKNDADDFSEQGIIKLKPIFDELKQEVSYNDIKIMLL
ncbi:MAG: ATP-dependent DNA helicase PIF1 [Arcobacteraceae bacterium]|jgi:ATP-dependent DNA helicase PIF1